MTTVLERRLAEFVDRTDEIAAFCKILDSGDPPIMAVWGGGGVGKSSLIARMIHESSLRELHKAEVIWTDTRSHNYLAVMRKIRDDIGAKYFYSFTDLVNYFTVPQYELKIKVDSNINIFDNAKIEGSSIGNVTGVYIEDVMMPESIRSMDITEDEKISRLTDNFISNFAAALSEVAKEKPFIVFLDAVEKMSIATRKWVWCELFAAVRDDRLPNTRFVVCGREEPPADIDREIRLMVDMAELKPLEQVHITEYLIKRGITEGIDELSMMLFASTGGNPLLVANNVDTYMKLKQKKNL